MNKWIFGAVLLLFAACTQDDELTDGKVQDLPEGKYPLEIASVSLTAESSAKPWGANAPQTRVSENTTDGNSSVWETNDEIRVRIDGYSDSDSKIYRMTVSNGTVAVSPSGSPVYWKNKDKKYVMARYPADGVVALDNQTKKLAYALFAKTVETADYNTTNISLPFRHKLAKIRVVLTGDKKSDVTEVKIKTLTSCTLGADGTLTNGNTEDFIPMVPTTYNSENCWEANVVPGYTIEKVKVNDVECTLTTSVTPVAENWHEVTIDVKKMQVEIKPGDDGNYTVNEGDNVLIKGNGPKTTGQIIINGTATVTIQDVNIETNAKSSIYIKNGTATIKLEGNNILNSINSSGGGAAGIELNGTGSHVIIEGNGNASLTVTADYGNPAIGSGNGGKGGNITIQNANITAKAINTHACGCGAAIGSGSSFYAGYAAEAHIGIITIINSDIKASVGSSGKSSAAVIGTGDTTYGTEKNSCDGINITLKAGQTKTQFLSNLTGTYNVQVGAGSNSRGGTTTCGSINWYNSDGSPAN